MTAKVEAAGEQMKQRVYVWDEPVEIDVYQKSKTVWIAVGEYIGKHHEVKRSTPGAAAKGWADAAKYHSN
jgi:hypothetical protein